MTLLIQLKLKRRFVVSIDFFLNTEQFLVYSVVLFLKFSFCFLLILLLIIQIQDFCFYSSSELKRDTCWTKRKVVNSSWLNIRKSLSKKKWLWHSLALWLRQILVHKCLFFFSSLQLISFFFLLSFCWAFSALALSVG